MISRRDAAACVIAFGLALAGCSGDVAQPGHAQHRGAANPAFTRLLAEAETAMADNALADAGRLLEEARSLSPENPDLWLAIARLRLRGGEHLTALEAADRALAMGPDYAPALLLRALMVRDAHGAPDALVWFEAARRADPENPDILAEYAATLGDSGEAGAMLKMVRALGAAAPRDPRVPWLQAVLAARGGQTGTARSLLARSGWRTREVPAALLLDALISLEEGNPDTAALTLETLAARQPANARVRELLARALFASGRDEELVRRFGPEAAQAEASPYLLMLVARAHERRGDRAAAAPLLARAYAQPSGALAVLAVREGLPPPTAAVRRALLAGNRDDARAEAEALRERLPASADVASLVGDALLGAGDPRKALAAYARAAEARRLWPQTRKAVWTYARLGEAAAADTLLGRHVAGEPGNASALVMLAARQADRGDWARAAALIDHALALGAGHDPALLALRLRAAEASGRGGDVRRFAALLAEVRPRRLDKP